jgi:uncharacterized membrane protein affecting hemolysin expression
LHFIVIAVIAAVVIFIAVIFAVLFFQSFSFSSTLFIVFPAEFFEL